MKTYTDAGTYVSTYGAAGSLERLKEKLRDDPAEPFTDAFGVINPALRGTGKMGKLISKIPGVEYSKTPWKTLVTYLKALQPYVVCGIYQC
jgi:hypothetical protein